jgi:leader peptidase (prepilin peptidase) / N-methyltransferase
VLVLLAVFAALVGLVVGSFLNVVIWRVPRGESVVRPPSHCPGCDTPIAPRDNIPVLSWVLLRGRCRSCGEPISARYPLVEAGTAVVFVLITLRIGLDWPLPAYLYLGAIGVALALIDIDVRRLPDSIVLPSYPVALVLLAAASLLGHDWSAFVRGVIGLVALFGFYFLLALIYPAGMGFGDVKLAGLLGLYLAYLGWGELVVGAFLGFLYGGVVGALLMLAQRAGRKSKIPFGPYMLLGAFTALLVGGALADLYLDTVVA